MMLGSHGNRFPLPFAALQNSVSLSTDVSGIPALTIGPDNQVYFAAAMKGTRSQFGAFRPSFITTATPNGTPFLYNIVVGNYDSLGSPYNYTSLFGPQSYWAFYNSANLRDAVPTPVGPGVQFNVYYQLQGTTDDHSPSIAVGPDLELYVAYVTASQIPERTNMANVPSFCGCMNQGMQDIVVARLTNLNKAVQTSTGPGTAADFLDTVANWRLQDATFNSCSDETVPKLAIDRRNRFLYMVHQTNYQILCYPVVGTDPNIVLSCLNLTTGTIVWREAQGGVNSSGRTRAPAVAVDTLGGIYVAAEITGPMTGGRDLSGAAATVDVVKFSQVSTSPGVYGSRTRSWVLSQFVNLNPGAGLFNKEPTIASDPVSGNVLLAFVTTGTMPGKHRSPHLVAGGGDVVVVTMKGDGSGIRVQQGGAFNPMSRPYQTASTPYATTDPYGNFYLSVNTQEAASPHINNVLLFKVLRDGSATWSYSDGPLVTNAYAMAGVPFPHLDDPPLPGDAPNSIFPAEADHSGTPVPAVYSQTPIAVGSNVICTATVTNNAQDVTPGDSGFPGSNGLCVGYFKEALYYLNDDAYQYMTVRKSICACGGTDCGC